MSVPLSRLVARVRQRLFLQHFGSRLVVLGSSALLLLAMTILLIANGRLRTSPWSIDSPLFLTRLAWLGGTIVFAALLAAVLAWLRRPSPLAAALSIDRTFKLHERISTSLTLSPEQATSPAGQALAADTERCLKKLSIAPAYPLKPSSRAALLPLGFVVCLLAIFFCDRTPNKASAGNGPVNPALKADLDEVQKGLKELAKQTKEPQKVEKLPKGEALDKFSEEMERLAQKEPKTNEEAKDLFKDLSTLEEKMRRQDKGQADRAEALKQQTEEADRLRKRPRKETPPPHEKAMNEGDFRKAANELQRLSRELEDDKLSAEQRKEMDRDMEDLREKLDRIADVKKNKARDLDKNREKKEQKNRKDGQEGEEVDEQDLEDMREMSEEEKKEAEELAAAATDLEEMLKALKDGDKEKAAKKLQQAAQKLGKAGKGDGRQPTGKALAQLQVLKERLGRGMGQGSNPASGKRPEKPQEDINGVDTRSVGERAEGGISGFRFVPGQGLKEARKDEDVRPLIEGAGREAAEALQRQRVPRADADLTRGYFEKLRKGEPDKK